MSKKLEREFVKPLVAGGLAALASKMQYPNATISVKLLGDEKYPLWVMSGLAGVGSDFVAEMAHDRILPHIAKDEKLGHMEAMILSPVASGAAYWGIHKLYHPNATKQLGDMYVFGTGAGVNVSSEYVYSNFIDMPDYE